MFPKGAYRVKNIYFFQSHPVFEAEPHIKVPAQAWACPALAKPHSPPRPGRAACVPWVAQLSGGISPTREEAPPSHLDPRAQPSWPRLPRVSVKLKNILLILNNHVGLAGLPPPDRWRTHASGCPALHINLSLTAFSTSFQPRALSSFSL